MNDFWYQSLIRPLTETYFQKALFGGSIVAAVCSVVGCLVILRRMAFLGDALSHAMIAGVVTGYLLMKVVFGVEASAPAMLVGSVFAAALTVTLIGFVSRASRLKKDTVIGIMYCGIFAAGIVLLTIFQHYVHIDIMHFIMGDILGISDTDLWLTVFVAGSVLSVIILFFRQFQITSFDPVMAASIGVPVLLMEYVLTSCMSFVVVSAVSMVGVILSVGLLITPAATAYLLTDRLNRMMILAALFGVLSVWVGLYLAVWLDAAGGVSIMLYCSVQFMIVLMIAPRYGVLAGWQRRRRMVPQQLVEDILRALLRADATCQIGDLVRQEIGGPERHALQKALRSMEHQHLIQVEGQQVALTPEGKAEGERITRAHRLWESYLEHVGEPLEGIHNQAHKLEHIHDEEAVHFIDDLLGHPTHDPHGTLIPEDMRVVAAGMIAPISLLHTGRRATVKAIRSHVAGQIPFEIGEAIQIGDRLLNSAVWRVQRQNGETVQLNHQLADAIYVQLSASK